MREQARTRFSDQTLATTLKIVMDESCSTAEREIALEALMKRRERERRALFEDFNRAHLPLMLHVMLEQGLVEREELTGLSLELRRILGLLDR